MIIRTSVVRSLLIAGLMSVAVAATAQNVDTYQATLTGSEEVPPVSTSAKGTGEFQLNRDTSTLTWKVTYEGLSGPATGAHVHGPAEAGKNAGVLVPFANVTAQPIQGEKKLTPEQVADLKAGRWYANIHTAAHPGGEIRGQLKPRQ